MYIAFPGTKFQYFPGGSPHQPLCASTMKILGVTISSRSSLSDHVTNLISRCYQTLRDFNFR